MILETIIFTSRKVNKGFYIFLALFFSLVIQAADVTVSNLSPLSELSWTIVNVEGHIEYASVDFCEQDTCLMELVDDQHYSWNIEVGNVAVDDTILLTLAVNGAVIIAVQNDVEKGETFSPFVAGYKEPVMKIVGGTSVDIKDYPWQIYFRFGDFMCGGTIIADHWILTAAHCTQDKYNNPVSISDMSVLVGASNPYNDTGKWYNVKSYTIHENYSNTTFINDIAVLELDEDIDYVNAEPIELISLFDVDSGATIPGVMSTVTGWGVTRASSNQTSDDFPILLQKVELPIVDNSVGEQFFSNVIPSMLMAGYENGTKDACSGDSGGPLTVVADGETKIAGIVSYGSETCNTYGGYTRISSYLDWIEDKTGVLPSNTLQVPVGDVLICSGTDVSTYICNNTDYANYEWLLVPDSVGVLLHNENEASIHWTEGFEGEATLSVRAEKENKLSSWRNLIISVIPLTVVSQFSNDTVVCEKDLAILSVDAEGYNLSYEWYKDDILYSNSSSSQLIFLFADTLDSGNYKCVVHGFCGDVTSPTMQLTVIPNTHIYNTPSDVNALQNSDVEIEVKATGYQLKYQWYKDFQLIEGQENQKLQLSSVNTSDIGQYYAVVSGRCLTDTSDTVYVYVDYDSTFDNNARVWPTVTDDKVNVAISTNAPFSVKIYNTLGFLVFQGSAYVHQVDLDISSLGEGLYFAEVESENIKEVFRFFKNN